ncbi:UNVERIFIED_CONTAM: 16S rRNA (adenine(1408)-N(1))-methyltransferase [Acetivibrio alkalicellulosi]
MRILKGKSVVEMTDLNEVLEGFESVIVDIGTGNGRFVYKHAQSNKNNFYIGVDPAAENMMEYASKIIKKPKKGGLNNALYVICGAEELPEEIYSKADKIYINLPWGSLLEGVVKGNDVILENIVKVAKSSQASLEIWFTYNNLHEAGEMSRRELPALSVEYIKDTLVPIYNASGIEINDIEIVTNEELKEFDTQWSKRLGFGRAREVYRIKAVIRK